MQPFGAQFHANVAQFGSAPCWRYRSAGQWQTVSWLEVGERVARLSTWLLQQGLRPGECVAIWSTTRWEWALADLAVLMAGGVSVPIYHNLPLAQAQFIITEPGCQFLILERDAGATRVTEILAACPQLQHIITMETSAGPGEGAYALPHILADTAGDQAAYTARWQARDEQCLASIVYTSGTTGTPKGVELSLANFRHEVEGLVQVLPFPHDYECLAFLPLAHIVARALHFYQLMHGVIGVFAEGLEQLGDNIRETRPHFFVGVPRIYEKIQAKLLAQVAQLPPMKRRLFHWALRVGGEFGACRQAGRRPGWGLAVRHRLARRIFAPVHAKLGGRLRLVISGGAPLGAEVADFFHRLGILILEGYGLTETTAAVAINHIDAYCFGSVGKILDGVQVQIAVDGEILVRGATVFRGYFQRPEETAAVLTPEGWFHTGDIGALSADGFLTITDRKKDLIKTSGGKYIAPQPIENALKRSPYISDAMVHGDRRKYLSAVLTLERSAVEAHAAQAGISSRTWEELLGHPQVLALIQSTVDQVNAGLASHETIKQFRVLPKEFAVESGELTPTLKIRRKIAYERYRDLFDAMYSEPNPTIGASHDDREHLARRAQ